MSDRDDDSYAGYASDYDSDDDSDREDEPRRGPVIFLLALGVLLVVSTVIWNAYRQGVREGGKDAPPRIVAEGPVKVAPVDPGGETTPGQDVAVYDQLESKSGTGPAEAPAADAAPPMESPRAPAAVKTAAATPPAPKPTAAAGGPVTTPSAPAPAIVFVKDGPFVAQIAALRTPEAADTHWTKVSKLAPDLFAKAQKDVQRADLGAKGIFFRLRAGSFQTRDAANAFCDQVVATGESCIVAAR